VTDNVISVPFELDTWPVLFHPYIKHIMQKQICQKWANDAPNAKGNFEPQIAFLAPRA
jgi:hypothetical protein